MDVWEVIGAESPGDFPLVALFGLRGSLTGTGDEPALDRHQRHPAFLGLFAFLSRLDFSSRRGHGCAHIGTRQDGMAGTARSTRYEI